MRARALISTLEDLIHRDGRDATCYYLSRTAELLGIWILSVSKPVGSRSALCVKAEVEDTETILLMLAREFRSGEFRPLRARELVLTLRRFTAHKSADFLCYLEDEDYHRRAVSGVDILSGDTAAVSRHVVPTTQERALVLS